MSLSRAVRPRWSLVGGLTVALAAWLFLPQTASAQQFRPIPPDAKGYQVVQITQQNLRHAAAPRSVEVTRRSLPATYQVVPEPEPSLPRVVTFEAPDGSVRTFVLEGSIRVAEPRYAVVRLISK